MVVDKRQNRFPKTERLCSRKVINELFANTDALLVYPLRCVYKKSPVSSETRPPIRVMVSVPKRNHKHAVSRNIIKRRMREAYRLNRHQLSITTTESGVVFDISLNYIAREIHDYKTIEHAVKKIFAQLGDSLTVGIG